MSECPGVSCFLMWFFYVSWQARLSLCKFMVTPSTLIVLDEPTNHLDIPSKEMLEVTDTGPCILIFFPRALQACVTKK